MGSKLPEEVYFHRDPAEPSPRSSDSGFWHQDEDGSYSYWEIAEDGEFYCQDSSGLFWAWSDWDALSNSGLSPEQQKEIDEAYAVADAKARTFTQARQAIRARNLSRGFYPVNPSWAEARVSFLRLQVLPLLCLRPQQKCTRSLEILSSPGVSCVDPASIHGETAPNAVVLPQRDLARARSALVATSGLRRCS